MFVLHNLSRLLERPAALQERVFTRLFEAAEIAKFTPEKRMEYEESLKVYRDLTNVIDTATWKSRMEGRMEERLSNARKMKEEGLDPVVISRITNLSAEEVAAL
ncbi:PD-(D/E)XK nuclease family transposase [Bacteroides sp.]|uniref:PD-(D/E)XK nuclease family transposase n=1 Tax=Bacteroides TaxID=816 RepID=UPI0035270CEB